MNTFADRVRQAFTDAGYTLLTSEYKNNVQKLDFTCPNSHLGRMTWKSFQEGHRCMDCTGTPKLTIEYVRERFLERGYKLLSTDYAGNEHKLLFECTRGHLVTTTWGTFNQGKGCADCGGRKKKTLDFIREEFTKRGYELKTEIYKNGTQKLEYICPKGHCGGIKWGHFQSGHGCAKCFFENNTGPNNSIWSDTKTDEERKVQRKYPEYWRWRSDVVNRDGKQCQSCYVKVTIKTAHAHHILNYAEYPHLRTDVSNGVTLCKICHEGFHRKYGRRNNNRDQFLEFILLKSEEAMR